MRSSPIAVLLAAAVFLGASGCGGEPETRRTVNPQAEALRFFGQDTLAVALLDPRAPAADLERLREATAGTPLDVSLSTALDGLNRAGIGRAQLREALDGPIAIGAHTLDDLREGRLLFAASGEPERVDQLVDAAIRRGVAEEAARYRGARLLHAGEGAAAVRDGVLIAGPDLEELRGALEIRDTDREELRLDDAEVGALFDQLGGDEPVAVHVRVRSLIAGARVEPGAALLPAVRAARSIALGVEPIRGGRLGLVVVARFRGGEVSDRELFLATGDRPARVHVEPSVPALGLRDARLAAEGLLRTLGRLEPALLATAHDVGARLRRAGIEPEELADTVEGRNVSLALEPAGGATVRVEVSDSALARRALEALLGEARQGVHGPASLQGMRIGAALDGRSVGIGIDGGDPRSAAMASSRPVREEVGTLAFDLPVEALLAATGIARPPAPFGRAERISGSLSRDGDRLRGRVVVELAG